MFKIFPNTVCLILLFKFFAEYSVLNNYESTMTNINWLQFDFFEMEISANYTTLCNIFNILNSDGVWVNSFTVMSKGRGNYVKGLDAADLNPFFQKHLIVDAKAKI